MNGLEFQPTRFPHHAGEDDRRELRQTLKLWLQGLRSLRVLQSDEPMRAKSEIDSILRESDASAIENDWRQTGVDLNAAIVEYADEQLMEHGPLRNGGLHS